MFVGDIHEGRERSLYFIVGDSLPDETTSNNPLEEAWKLSEDLYFKAVAVYVAFVAALRFPTFYQFLDVSELSESEKTIPSVRLLFVTCYSSASRHDNSRTKTRIEFRVWLYYIDQFHNVFQHKFPLSFSRDGRDTY